MIKSELKQCIKTYNFLFYIIFDCFGPYMLKTGSYVNCSVYLLLTLLYLILNMFRFLFLQCCNF